LTFEFILHPSLPRLAWCAHVRRGRKTVEVYHGPWVETSADWFVEGAWTGPFCRGGVAEADHAIGTAGRAERDRVVFCSPTNLSDRIHTVRVDDDLYASNSMAFLLQTTEDAPDPFHLNYMEDRRRQQTAGIKRPDKRLPTALGRQVVLHDYCNVAVGPDLSIQRMEKPGTPPPVSYGDYVGRLDATIASLLANAADPLRKHRRYRPVATLSRGYDGNALAVLLRRHGAREAMTFVDTLDDDGTEIGETLGYDVTRYIAREFLKVRGGVEAEFLAVPWGSDVVLAVCAEQLEGALLISGRHGDIVLTTRAPGGEGLTGFRVNPLAGASLSEFRLRVGFLQFVPLFVGALHPRSLHAISVSPEMKPWSVGGPYDRPILRRILEEAGIPRASFGQRKHGSSHYLVKRPQDMSADSVPDFLAFLESMPPIPLRERFSRRFLEMVQRIRVRIVRGSPAIRAAIGVPAPTTTLDMERLFHWAFARVRTRYDMPKSN
jgi:hypothetical protein